jgi:hypothetical protein
MSEVGRTSPAARAVTTALMRQWHDAIATGVRQMQQQHKIAPRIDADRAAARCWPESRAESGSCWPPATSAIWKPRWT